MGYFLFFIERDTNPLGEVERRKTARRSCGFEIRRQKGSTYLLADLKSASSKKLSFLRRSF